MERAKQLWMLLDRKNAVGLGMTVFETEEDMRRADEALNAMSPGGPPVTRSTIATRDRARSRDEPSSSPMHRRSSVACSIPVDGWAANHRPAHLTAVRSQRESRSWSMSRTIASAPLNVSVEGVCLMNSK